MLFFLFVFFPVWQQYPSIQARPTSFFKKKNCQQLLRFGGEAMQCVAFTALCCQRERAAFIFGIYIYIDTYTFIECIPLHLYKCQMTCSRCSQFPSYTITFLRKPAVENSGHLKTRFVFIVNAHIFKNESQFSEWGRPPVVHCYTKEGEGEGE